MLTARHGIFLKILFAFCGRPAGQQILRLEERISSCIIKEFWNIFNERSKEQNIEPVKNDLFRLYFHPKLNTETYTVYSLMELMKIQFLSKL